MKTNDSAIANETMYYFKMYEMVHALPHDSLVFKNETAPQKCS